MALTEYLGSRVEQSPEEYLFLKTNGKPMDRIGIACRLGKLSRKTGIPVTPHTLRRAFVTINANKGRPLPMLQIACGHSDITTTRSYCLTTEDETIEAMQSWD
jgi:site-specific recombinase XerD